MKQFKDPLGIDDVKMNENEEDDQKQKTFDTLLAEVNAAFDEEFDQRIEDHNDQFSLIEKYEEKENLVKEIKENHVK